MPEMRARRRAEGSRGSAVVGIRELSRHTGKIVDEVTATGRPKIVTSQGRTAAIIQPIDTETMLEEVIVRSPWFISKRKRGLAELDAGRSLTEDQADALRTRPTRTQARKPARRRKAKAPTRRKAKAPTRRKAKAPTRRKAKAPTRRKAKAPTRRKAKAPTRRKAKAPTRRKARTSARRVARRH